MAPGLQSARVVALRPAGKDAYGRPRLDCVLAGQWRRAAFEGVRWQTADAATVAQDTAAELLVDLRRGNEMVPLDLSDQPAIRALVEVVDIDDLTG